MHSHGDGELGRSAGTPTSTQNKIKKALNLKTRISEDAIWRLAYNVLEGLNKLH